MRRPGGWSSVKTAAKTVAKEIGSAASDEAKELGTAATRKVRELGKRRRQRRVGKHQATEAAIRVAEDRGVDLDEQRHATTVPAATSPPNLVACLEGPVTCCASRGGGTIRRSRT